MRSDWLFSCKDWALLAGCPRHSGHPYGHPCYSQFDSCQKGYPLTIVQLTGSSVQLIEVMSSLKVIC